MEIGFLKKDFQFLKMNYQFKFQFPNQISLEELEKSFPKPLPFPKKYLKVLQRLLNTDEGGVKISDFTDAAGGGTLASTGGEILTMMMTSIDDDNIASQLTERLTEHIKSNGNKKSIINTKWVESALKCRKSIRDRYDRMYGKGNWKLKNQIMMSLLKTNLIF